jgi:hypothetical protein
MTKPTTYQSQAPTKKVKNGPLAPTLSFKRGNLLLFQTDNIRMLDWWCRVTALGTKTDYHFFIT